MNRSAAICCGHEVALPNIVDLPAALTIALVVIYVIILVLAIRAALEPYLLRRTRDDQDRKQPIHRDPTNKASGPKATRPGHPRRAA